MLWANRAGLLSTGGYPPPCRHGRGGLQNIESFSLHTACEKTSVKLIQLLYFIHFYTK